MKLLKFLSPLKDLTYYALNDTTQVDSVIVDGSKRSYGTQFPLMNQRMVLLLDSVRTAIRWQRNFHYILIAGVCDYLLSGSPLMVL